MAWFKVDDQLAFNSKVMLAGNSAMGLWVRAGSWSSAQLTNGFIPAHMANAMANAMANPCDSDALVLAGLWDAVEGGFQFHDWADFQPDAEAEKEKRKATQKARSDAGKAGAAARWAKESNGKSDGKRNGKTHESHGKPMATEWQTDAPDPTRPDPIKELVNTPPKTPTGQTGTTLPNDFHVTAEMTSWAISNCPNIDALRSTTKFKAHYRSVSGRQQFKTDWLEAWKLWLMNDQDRAKPPTSISTKKSPWDQRGVHGYEEGETN